MSKKKKEPIDWDKLVKEGPKVNVEELPDPTCILIKPMPELGEMPEELKEALRGSEKDTK